MKITSTDDFKMAKYKMNKLNNEKQEIWIARFINKGGTEGRAEVSNVELLPQMIKAIQRIGGTNIVITNETPK